MIFIQVKALAGMNYIRASDVIAVSFTDRDKCNVMMAGGVTLSCVESAAEVSARIEAAVGGKTAPNAKTAAKEG